MSDEKSVCKLCGEPMPAGEEMFKFHGYSGPCPKPPSTAPAASESAEDARIELVVAIHDLASNFENSLYAFRGDAEARKKAEGDIAYARKVAGRHNRNGTARLAPASPDTGLYLCCQCGCEWTASERLDCPLCGPKGVTAKVTKHRSVAPTSAEPVAWDCQWISDGGDRLLTADPEDVRIARENGWRVTPLYAAPPPIPAGYRLVPVEATPEMLKACDTIIQGYGAKLVWGRMLAAAPESPT